MTYQQLVRYVEAQALAAGCASLWHGKETAKDINYDAPFPQAYLFLVPSTQRGGRIVSRIRMAFFGNDEHGSSTQASVAIQDAMDILSQRFIAALEEDAAGELGDVDRAPVTRIGSTIGTGFFVSFTFTTKALC